MQNKRYKVQIAHSGKRDIKQKKQYILQQFRYREYAENFSKKIKRAVKKLEVFPTSYEVIGFQYRGYDIYLFPAAGHLLFYTVDDVMRVVTVLRVLQDGKNWKYIIKQWIRNNAF